ncbi:MAG TPA: ABC transporter substrate-binding protein [Candidatus Sulfotelmatobacter sp.]|nr:ABC transporter substrate-binding protein [Candidatus Sulfotelmatobacter sp.]
MRALVRALALALAVAAAAGCTRAGSGNGRPADVLVLGETSEPSTLNPLLLEGPAATMVAPLIYSYLVTYAPDGRPIADVARTVPTVANGGIARDGLTVTYHLRPGVRWQDGRPLTARDCVFTFHAIMDPRTLAPDRHGYDQIASVRAPDDATLVVRLKRPYAPLVTTFLAPNANYPIMPAHLLAGLPDINHLDPERYTVGSGPYRFVRWDRGDQLVLAANAGYFRGRPRIARLVIRFVPDGTTIVEQLRTHELDGALDLIDPGLLASLRDLADTDVVTTPAWGVAIVYFNAQRGPTADPAVRRALSEAVDAERVIRRATQGAYGAAHAWRGLFGADAVSAALPRYDPTAARAALAGRHLALTLVYSTALPLYRVIATEVQAQLRAAGVDLALHAYAPGQFRAPAANGGPMFGGKFDLVLSDIYSTGDEDTAAFFACDERAPAGFNIARLCDPRFDAAAARAMHATDPGALRTAETAFETQLARDVPAIALCQLRFISAFDDRLRGVAPIPATPYAGAWAWSLRGPS